MYSIKTMIIDFFFFQFVSLAAHSCTHAVCLKKIFFALGRVLVWDEHCRKILNKTA